MIYLDLFSGIGGFALAVKRRFKNVESYHSEINHYANKVYNKHFPYSHSLGDVKNVSVSYFRERGGVDLFTAGFPCQSFSMEGKRRGFYDDNGKLFFKTIELLRKISPRYFILENVASMKSSFKDTITYMVKNNFDGRVFCSKLDSQYFSAQVRKRLFWTNFKINKVENKNKTCVQDILESGTALKNKAVTLTRKESGLCENMMAFYTRRNIIFKEKTSLSKIDIFRISASIKIHKEAEKIFRNFSPIERERLQTFPDNWTSVGLSNNIRLKLLGNTVTVDVISHILNSIPKEEL